MEIVVSRNGAILGSYKTTALREAIWNKTVLEDDYGWHEGLTEWQLMRELLPEYFPPPSISTSSLDSMSDECRMAQHIYILDEQIKRTEAHIEVLKNHLETAIRAGDEKRPRRLRDALASCRADIKDWKQELKAETQNRIDFWCDCFREEPLGVGWSQSELYESFGKAYKLPKRAQIIAVLRACDEKMPGWNQVRPAEFFTVLQSTFPELIR